ncbi:protein of unknown function [Petrocella atlantisensis]|uniref:Uncharacterized protein n=1 Tax=Petrocella atlantisensis TaxID=2173034 RepID=A0A3P7PFU4_9FIRM|nr:protein of unknown function [Petrocella atlantisensis]
MTSNKHTNNSFKEEVQHEIKVNHTNDDYISSSCSMLNANYKSGRC